MKSGAKCRNWGSLGGLGSLKVIGNFTIWSFDHHLIISPFAHVCHIIIIIIIIILAHQHKACRQLKIKQEMTAVGD